MTNRHIYKIANVIKEDMYDSLEMSRPVDHVVTIDDYQDPALDDDAYEVTFELAVWPNGFNDESSEDFGDSSVIDFEIGDIVSIGGQYGDVPLTDSIVSRFKMSLENNVDPQWVAAWLDTQS